MRRIRNHYNVNVATSLNTAKMKQNSDKCMSEFPDLEKERKFQNHIK